jgi:hypothetical protein
MNLVTHDTSVLMDLAEGGLPELFFQLGISSMTTSAVVEEIKYESQQRLVERFLYKEIQA